MTSATHPGKKTVPSYAFYLAVLPFYRQACMEELLRISGSSVVLFAGGRHIDKTVRTGISDELYTPVRNLVLFDKALLQLGHWRDAAKAETAVMDLNPRSLSVWVLLVFRRILGRRTLLWGHLFPRAGKESSTAVLRRVLRRLSQGTILYGYESVSPAKKESPSAPVWVAPNALYRRDDIYPAGVQAPRSSVLYVGRLEKSKKVSLLLRAFAVSKLPQSGVTVDIVGGGSEREELEALTESLGIAGSVKFWGTISAVEDLRDRYANALCSVSPGYVGLSLTQSLGFGVPMLVSEDEPHAPEIELRRIDGAVTFFTSDSESNLAAALEAVERDLPVAVREGICAGVRSSYSAESMAQGLWSALRDIQQEMGTETWATK